MARSHSIYLLIETGTGDYIGAFTVKHEMQKVRDRYPQGTTHCLRFRDNQPDVPATEV